MKRFIIITIIITDIETPLIRLHFGMCVSACVCATGKLWHKYNIPAYSTVVFSFWLFFVRNLFFPHFVFVKWFFKHVQSEEDIFESNLSDIASRKSLVSLNIIRVVSLFCRVRTLFTRKRTKLNTELI